MCSRSKQRLVHHFPMSRWTFVTCSFLHPLLSSLFNVVVHRWESDLDSEVMSAWLLRGRYYSHSVQTACMVFLAVISMHYAFNMVYLRGLYPVLIFIQHLVLGLKDEQPIPTSSQNLCQSSLDKLQL